MGGAPGFGDGARRCKQRPASPANPVAPTTHLAGRQEFAASTQKRSPRGCIARLPLNSSETSPWLAGDTTTQRLTLVEPLTPCQLRRLSGV